MAKKTTKQGKPSENDEVIKKNESASDDVVLGSIHTSDDAGDILEDTEEGSGTPAAEEEEGDDDKDSGSPQGNQSQPETKEDAVIPNAAKDSDEGQPGKEDVASAISKANEKVLKDLETVAAMLKDNPEKLDELRAQHPQIYDRLVKRVPDLFVEKAQVEPEAKAAKLANILDSVLKRQEEKDFENWRKNNGIAEADFAARKTQLEETARIIYGENLVKDWSLAIKAAGEIVFPHLSSAPVDDAKIVQLKGQSTSVSTIAPGNSEEFDENDRAIMRREKLSKDQYKKIQSRANSDFGIDVLEL